EKGAFSGAKTSGKNGLIEQAANGTLFLDEVGDLSLEAQAKLLRFLEEGEFYRVGGVQKLKIQTRIISATNKNLEEMIEQKLFRMDLYFRLGVIKIEIPSLNERRDDILLLAKHFLHAFMNKFGKNFNGLTKDAERGLLEHRWTGNVRELKNMIERGTLIGTEPFLTRAELGLEDAKPLPSSASNMPSPLLPPIPESGVDLASIEKRFEKYYIEEAYRMANGNESKAAKLLNINHHTYRYRRKKLLED
ncbi:MAG: sigma 54-interacting transcriptional regulator, partial [Desulfosarcinaceae bacterium]